MQQTAAYQPVLSNIGSVDDIRSSLSYREEYLSINTLEKEIEAEEAKGQHCRSSVVNLLQAAILRKKKRLQASYQPMRQISEMELSEG